ncbi:hypothetical protein NPIL_553541 [Nephila pilipes]|uniref:Uncharacterized protein n=1 Tax=Nephila pilipes TaxID=299642 RepID=A0A8X6I5H1_NEPPI|nr:hypothetical protein NPIL_553541 [Nephila pilipes]
MAAFSRCPVNEVSQSSVEVMNDPPDPSAKVEGDRWPTLFCHRWASKHKICRFSTVRTLQAPAHARNDMYSEPGIQPEDLLGIYLSCLQEFAPHKMP